MLRSLKTDQVSKVEKGAQPAIPGTEPACPRLPHTRRFHSSQKSPPKAEDAELPVMQR